MTNIHEAGWPSMGYFPHDSEPDQTNYAGATQKEWDAVSNPRHYHRGGVECIDVIDACVIGLTPQEAFRTGNAMKYLWRWKEKNGVEDLKKARQCIDMLIKIVESDNERKSV